MGVKRSIQELKRDSRKDNGNYYLGFSVQGLIRFRVLGLH